MKKYLNMVLAVGFIASIEARHSSIPFVDFDESLQTTQYLHLLDIPFYQAIYTRLKALYDHYNPAMVIPTQDIKIPRIIHQIWLGGNPPEEYQAYMMSWQLCNPGWEYRLWTDADVENFSFENKELFDNAINLGEKSDIWRYEILKHYGGFYADIDQECYQALEPFIWTYDFVIGIQPLDTNIVQLGIGIIGSRPYHPIWDMVIQGLKIAQAYKQIILKTGPLFFTRMFVKYAGTFGLCDVALPPTYFYPRGYTQGSQAHIWRRDESYAVHHWAGSWLK